MANVTKGGFVCCICKEHSFGWGNDAQYGNNPAPLNDGVGDCCDHCNRTKVVPARLAAMRNDKW